MFFVIICWRTNPYSVYKNRWYLLGLSGVLLLAGLVLLIVSRVIEAKCDCQCATVSSHCSSDSDCSSTCQEAYPNCDTLDSSCTCEFAFCDDTDNSILLYVSIPLMIYSFLEFAMVACIWFVKGAAYAQRERINT